MSPLRLPFRHPGFVTVEAIDLLQAGPKGEAEYHETGSAPWRLHLIHSCDDQIVVVEANPHLQVVEGGDRLVAGQMYRPAALTGVP